MILYDGSPIFGYANRLLPETNESASQRNAFFGVNGTQSLYGGSRGRTFVVRGVLVDNSGNLAGQIALIESYNDGVGRTLSDLVLTRSWDKVIFKKFRQTSERVLPGPAIEFEAMFEGEL